MDIKIKHLIVVSFALCAMFLNSCGKITGCADTSYRFMIGVKIHPNKETLLLGDTLWFEVDAPTTLKDVATGKLTDYSGALNLGSAVGFGKITANNVVFSANSFDYKLLTGTNVNNPNTVQIREFLFTQINDRYVFKLGVVPKEKGVFGIDFSNSVNVYRKSDRCTKALFYINFENTPHHYHLNPITGSDTTNNYGSYYFTVK